MRVQDQTTAIVGGMIADKAIKYTKNDKVMAILNLEDLVGNVEIVVFAQNYERYSHLLQEDAKVFIKGRVSVEEDKDGKLICEQIVSFDEAMQGGELFRSGYGRGSRGGYGNSGYGQGSQGYGQRGGAYGQNAIGQGQSGAGYGNSQNGAGYPGRQNYGQNATGNVPGQAAAPRTIKKVPDGVWIQFSTAEEYAKREKELLEAIADSDGKDNVVIYIRDTKAIKILPANLCVSMDEALKEKLSAIFGGENVKFRC